MYICKTKWQHREATFIVPVSEREREREKGFANVKSGMDA